MPATKFTPANRASVLASISAGTTLEEASRAVGLHVKTLESWLARGRREDAGDYAEFTAAINESREAIERSALGREDFELELARAVRRGNVTAMKLWWTVHGTDDDSGKKGDAGNADPFDDLEDDELAERRERRTS